MTGAELKAIRRAQGISQTSMAALIGCSRHAVSYWECKGGEINTRWGVPARMLEALGVVTLPIKRNNTRGRGDGVLYDSQQAWVDREIAQSNERAAQKAARYRQPCGAKTRKGKPCRNKSEAGKRRCKFHGGMSTGPRTPEGKARITEAQKQRWAAWRKENADGLSQMVAQ